MIRVLFALMLSAILGAFATVPDAATVSDRRFALTFDDVPRGRGAFFADEERTRRIIATPRWYDRNGTALANELFRSRVLGIPQD